MSKFQFKIVGIIALVVMLGVLVGVSPVFADNGTESADADGRMPAAGQQIPWADFIGAPVIPSATNGLWVWSEDVSGQQVLHVRVGSDGSAHTFTGIIRTGGVSNFYDAVVVNGTGDDTVTSPRYNRVDFTLATTGGGEGVDVNWSGAWLVLDLQVDGVSNPAQIFYGAAGTAATGNPLGVRAGREGWLALPITMLDGPTAFERNIANGYYLYRTPNGVYHMRLTTTSTDTLVLYRGSIITEEGFFRAKRRFLGDPRDYVFLVRPKEVLFQFFTLGHLDGFDWIVGGGAKPDNMTFTLKMNGKLAAPNISLGSNPFGTVKAYTFRLVE
ncbi:MAG: hypothetical protein HY741_29665 [Chloroflexi bacterium]|nr:hypothetical protein [Chloroflexota bacterium]